MHSNLLVYYILGIYCICFLLGFTEARYNRRVCLAWPAGCFEELAGQFSMKDKSRPPKVKLCARKNECEENCDW